MNQSFVRRYLAGDRAVASRMLRGGPEPWEIVGYLPARRGTSVDPIVALRQEQARNTSSG